MRVSTARRISQLFFFTLFTLLFLLTVYPYPEKFDVNFFLQLDPLAAAAAMIASRAFIHAMALSFGLLLLSLLLGRFFCGWVCPLGALIDFSDRFLFRAERRPESPLPKAGRRFKYFLLTALLAAALAGVDLAHFLSPMSITPRFFTVVVFPPLLFLANFFMDAARPLVERAGMDSLAQLSFKQFLFSGGFGVFSLTALILMAGIWRRRFFCRTLCPSGALFSLFSRTGLFKRKVEAGQCNDCGRCRSSCRMRAIADDPRKTLLSECILCGECADACARHGNSIGIAAGRSGNDASLNLGRRSFVRSAAAGLALAGVVKADVRSGRNINGTFIRPPGSVPEGEFLARCIRCGLCLKTCKTNGLQPAAFEAGLDGLWSPRLVPRIGGCEDKCNMCGLVCPTGAIRALPMEEKKYVKMGTAVIDRARCIAWEQDKLCLICDEICPTDAIDMRVAETGNGPFKVPFVNEDRCIGCGLCENRCPIAGRSAIEVYSIGEERKSKGSYVTPEKVRLRESKDASPQPEGSEEGLPGGFITE